MALDENTQTKENLTTLINKSNLFPIAFPISSMRCEELLKRKFSEDILEENINSVYPIVHENVLNLYKEFLNLKKNYGSPVERDLYKNMNLQAFIDRLLKKRAVMFVGECDYYMLLNGETGIGNWETIGTKKEKAPCILKDYLSYDEIKLSAFLSVSSYTYFINNGNRYNCGKFDEETPYTTEEKGVIIGLIGPRFKNKNVMDYQDIVISPIQNTKENNYGNTPNTIQTLMAKFYKRNYLPTFKEAAKSGNHTILNKDLYFDDDIYKRRISISIDTLFHEANYRAKLENTTAYVHVVGIGLGNWMLSQHQSAVFMDACAERIEYLGKHLKHVSDICFSYINETHCGKYENEDIVPIEGHPKNGIKIYIQMRQPHTKLEGADKGKLLVVSYAWDGNALPGNEFWCGELLASGDSAAASSTQISELHNPHINSNVCAANLKVATETGIVDFQNDKFKV